MKEFRRLPFFAKIVLGILLGTAAMFTGNIVTGMVPGLRQYFPFAGVILVAAVSFLLYTRDRKQEWTSGLQPRRRNIGWLFAGFAIGVLALAIASFLRTIYTGEQWHLSSSIDAGTLLNGLYFLLPSVMMEELMFRGYLFTTTVDRFGVVIANVTFAVLFMLVHVLDREVIKNPARIIMLAAAIPVGHLLFATALLRAKTIFFPVGIHWGNNWAVNHLAGQSDTESVIFFTTHQKIYTSWLPFIIMLLIFNLFFLAVCFFIWKWGKFRKS